MKTRLLTLLPALFALGACTDTTAPSLEAVDDQIVAQFAEEASEASDVRLPSLGALLHASRVAIQASDGNAEALRYFRQAHRLAVAAADSADAGATDAARQLAGRSYRMTLHGVIAALGDQAASNALAGSTAALARIRANLADREVPARITARLDRIAAIIVEGEARLAAGEAVAALHHSLGSAEAIRGLSPAYLARKRMAQATKLFRAAVASVGDAPTEEEGQALRHARRLLGAAKQAFDAGAFGRAVEAATRAGTLAAGVLQGRS